MGLTQKSIPDPQVRDPDVRVRLLAAMFVTGKEHAIGDEVSMAKSDAQYLEQCCSPPRVERI